MSRNTVVAILVGAALLAAGCGTILRGREKGVYRGVKWDVGFIQAGCQPYNHDRDARISEQVGQEAKQAFMVVFGILDIPVSAVFDTLFLPYDLIVME